MANMTTQEILQGVKDWTTGKLNSNDAKNGYYVCSTDANVAAKTISATNYVLGNGGSIKVKMTNANTADNATLNINSTGAKALYYDGERASANNSWEAGETVEVYYDGTSFYANNVAGGSGSGDGAFDVSAKYPTSGVGGGNTYTLEGALAVLNANLSASKKKGGMSIKFVQSSDNKYVQFRYMESDATTVATFTNIANWQGVDDEPTAGSKNLVESGGVAKNTGYFKYKGNLESSTVLTYIIPIFFCDTINAFRIKVHSNNYSSIGYSLIFTDSTEELYSTLTGNDIVYTRTKDIAQIGVYVRSNQPTQDYDIELYAGLSGNLSSEIYNISSNVDNLVVDSLTSSDATKALSANQGKVLSDNLTQLGEEVDDNYLEIVGDTSHEILDTTDEQVGSLAPGLIFRNDSTYGNWRFVLLDVSRYKGRTLHIVPLSTSRGTTYIYLKDNMLIPGMAVNACMGYTDTVVIYSTTDVTIPDDCNYLWVRTQKASDSTDYTPQSLLILAKSGLLDGKVDKVEGKGLSENDYTDADKAKVDSIPAQFVTQEDLDNYVSKEQGTENAGLILKVGENGKVTLGTGSGTQPDISETIRRKVTKTIYLGTNILSGVIGSGTGWTENSGTYEHATGAESTIEFNLATDSGDAYVAIFSYSTVGMGNEAVTVKIGNGIPCDIYNGTLGPFYVGMVSDGGYLKITAKSDYGGVISGVELRKIVTQEQADTSVTLDTSNNKHFENVDGGTTIANLTGWWNVAIGATDAMKANQNGSRCIAIGQRSLEAMKGGTRNIGIGTFSLSSLVYGVGNVAIGTDAGWYMTGGNDNVIVGKSAFGEIRASNPQSNVAIGNSALSINTSLNPENNIAIGTLALAGGDENTTKTDCVAIGYSAGRKNNTKCIAIGTNSAFYILGEGNVAIGYDAMNKYNVDGQNNICIGHLAKLYPSSTPATIDNAIVIGYNARATKSNQIVLGTSSHTEVVIAGKKIVFNNDNTVTWETIS